MVGGGMNQPTKKTVGFTAIMVVVGMDYGTVLRILNIFPLYKMEKFCISSFFLQLIVNFPFISDSFFSVTSHISPVYLLHLCDISYIITLH